jgi:hypothetical protein
MSALSIDSFIWSTATKDRVNYPDSNLRESLGQSFEASNGTDCLRSDWPRRSGTGDYCCLRQSASILRKFSGADKFPSRDSARLRSSGWFLFFAHGVSRTGVLYIQEEGLIKRNP